MGTPVVALIGNPNSGKTTLFNALTGLNYKVANYPGVTVERKEATIALNSGRAAQLVDLPGVYSLSGISIDEKIATAEVLSAERKPDLLVQVCDATNLERNFYLLSELIDTGIKVILCLTMVDLVEKTGLKIHKELLSRQLGIPVVSIVARKKEGLEELLHTIEQSLQGENLARPFAWRDELVGESAATSDYDPTTHETELRYKWIGKIVRNSTSAGSLNKKSITGKLDRVLTDRIWGTLIFVLIMLGLFQSIFVLADYPMQGLDWIVEQCKQLALQFIPAGQFRSLVTQGIIAGVGSVIVFVPQIGILFCLLAILEDTGYLSRAAFLMDRILRPFGLQGRSFIPLLSSFACAIPGIMSTRTIPSWADRLTTILIAPLMSCSARLPVYTVLIGAFVPNTFLYGVVSLQGLTLLGMYSLGIVGAALVSAILRLVILRGAPAIFVMEMPPYRFPIVRNIIRTVADAVVSFLRSAGTVILAITILLWFLASYPRPTSTSPAESLETGVALSESYAGQLGKLIEPVIAPLGFNWEIGVSVIASFAAREVFVSSLSTVYNLQNNDDSSQNLVELLKQKKANGSFTSATAASLLVFYVFACMCMSTLAVTKRETGGWFWPSIMFFYMTGLAYILSAVTYKTWISLWP